MRAKVITVSFSLRGRTLKYTVYREGGLMHSSFRHLDRGSGPLLKICRYTSNQYH